MTMNGYSGINYKCNKLYLLIRMIEHKSHNWFKQTILLEVIRY